MENGFEYKSSSYIKLVGYISVQRCLYQLTTNCRSNVCTSKNIVA